MYFNLSPQALNTMRCLFIATKKSVSWVPTNTRAIYSMPYKIHMVIFYTVIFMASDSFSCLLHVNALRTGYRLMLGKVEICYFFFSKFKGYPKNHWTNTRLLLTHLNAFFIVNPNMAIKKTKFRIFLKKKFEKCQGKCFLSSALDIGLERVIHRR